MDHLVWQQKLSNILKEFNTLIGTIHRYNPADQHLYLVAHSGLPPDVLAADKYVPVGKGIGGTAAQSKKPVVLSNAQLNIDGVVFPKVKNMGTKGAICVPILEGNELVGTLGIGFLQEYEFTQNSIEHIINIGHDLLAELKQFPFFNPNSLTNKKSWKEILDEVIKKFEAPFGMVHRLDATNGELYLIASNGIPDEVLIIDKSIPLGKGPIGMTALEKKPVINNNFQKDQVGKTKPGVQATHVQGGLCVPIFDEDEVVGTLGVGFLNERDFSHKEVDDLIETLKLYAKQLRS